MMPTKLEKGIDWGTKLRGLTVTYCFAEAGQTVKTFSGKVETVAFNGYEKAQFKLAFELYASFTKLKFVKAKSQDNADFVLTAYQGDERLLGSMGPPGTKLPGIGAFNVDGDGWDRDAPGAGALEQGGYGYITIIHELGHGLGLAHPHDRGGGSPLFPGVSDDRPLGKYGLNQGVYTTMSYQDGWKLDPNGLPPEVSPYGYQGMPMAIDIAVLQAKYGVNETYHKGNDVYVLPDENGVGTYFSCIWDTGGRDAIVSVSASPTAIDLRAATLKVEPGGGGYISYVDGVFGGYTIAHKVVIENAVGGSGDDYLSGNGKKNRLKGGDGDDQLFGRRSDDRLEGGAGDDLLVGGRGDDRLFAGSNKGTMTGGAGKDTFIFDAVPAPGSIIAVTDFAPRKDIFHLSVDAFAALVKGKLPDSAFALGAAAADALDRIVYDVGTGVLRYDPDGAGGADAIDFALLSPGLALSHKDFVVIA